MTRLDKFTTNKMALIFLLVIACQLGGVSSVQPPAGPSGGTKTSEPRAAPSEGEFTEDDFHQLTDKLTQKIMRDIEKYKVEDPNWGKPPEMPAEDEDMDMTEPRKPPKSDCDFTCPAGQIQEERDDVVIPKFTNCKKYDHSWDRIPGASACCAKHHRCYHTCLRERTMCDQEFGGCMEGICESLQESGKVGSEEVAKACHAAMGLLGMIVMEPGCKMYPKAQGTVCRCVDKTAPSSTAGADTEGVSKMAASAESKKKTRRPPDARSGGETCSREESCDTEEKQTNPKKGKLSSEAEGGDRAERPGERLDSKDAPRDRSKDEL